MLNLKNLHKQSEVKAQDIQHAISGRFLDHKYVIFNSYLFDWESDYISVNESGYVYECEIKVTKNDFKKDFNKTGKHLLLESKSDVSKLPNKFFYAVPRGLLTSYEIPSYAGLIEISDTDTGKFAEVIVNAPFLHKENVFEKIKPLLLDKFYHKYKRTEYENYELNKKLDELKKELESKK